jgi:hypothetical protein
MALGFGRRKMKSCFRSRGRVRALLASAAGSIATLALTQSAGANLIIVPTFAANILSDPNSAAIMAGINATIQRAQDNIANPITVRITFQEGGGLGGSSQSVNGFTYATYRNALANNQILSANDNTALATLPVQAANPVNGTNGVFLTHALSRALGLEGASASSDCTITLNTSIMNLSRSGAQNGSFYDLQAVAAHEIDEALNVGGPGTALPTTGGSVGAEDLFRYSANGVRSFTTSSSATAYFSINGGATNIVNFNQTGSGDYADWAASATKRVQDATGTPNTQLNIGPAELTALDVVGWNMVVPEPASLSLVGLAAVGLLRKRR